MTKTIKQTISAALTIAAITFGAPAIAEITGEQLQAAVDKAHKSFLDVKDGANADYIPILAEVPSDLFGVAIVTK